MRGINKLEHRRLSNSRKLVIVRGYLRQTMRFEIVPKTNNRRNRFIRDRRENWTTSMAGENMDSLQSWMEICTYGVMKAGVWAPVWDTKKTAVKEGAAYVTAE